jgi:hypothetical protein
VAFVAALLGGILSPLISDGMSRLAEYEIEWPEVRRKIRPIIGREMGWLWALLDNNVTL